MRYLISNFQFRYRHSTRQYTLFRKKRKLVNEEYRIVFSQATLSITIAKLDTATAQIYCRRASGSLLGACRLYLI